MDFNEWIYNVVDWIAVHRRSEELQDIYSRIDLGLAKAAYIDGESPAEHARYVLGYL